MLWLTIEWSASLLGLLGAYLLANKNISPIKAWVAWIASDLLFISLFALHTGQYGLLTMNAIGGAISIMGLLQWSKFGKSSSNSNLKNNLFFLSMTALVFAFGALLSLPIIENKSTGVEWLGSFLSISGGLLMASKHKLAPLSWITWTLANSIILFLTIYTQQWGVAFLQVGFTIMNFYGCYTWLYKKKFLTKLRKVKHMNLRVQAEHA